jgi:hypothetical protein
MRCHWDELTLSVPYRLHLELISLPLGAPVCWVS